MRKVSLERYYFVLYDGVLTLKIAKITLNSFCDKTIYIHVYIYIYIYIYIVADEPLGETRLFS